MKQPKVLQGTGKTAGLALAASFLYFIACGIRNNFGVMLAGIIENTGMAFASVSFVLAVGQLCYGVTQPMFGVLADRKGNWLALLAGILCTAAGVLLLPYCKTQITLMLTLGILLPGGLGALSFGILMGAILERIPEKSSTLVSGVVNASSGIGNTVLTPVISMTIVAGGLRYSMGILAVPTLLMLPVMLLMCGKGMKKKTPTGEEKRPGIVGVAIRKFHFIKGFKNQDFPEQLSF